MRRIGETLTKRTERIEFAYQEKLKFSKNMLRLINRKTRRTWAEGIKRESFRTHEEARQGRSLSWMLFPIFVADLEKVTRKD